MYWIFCCINLFINELPTTYFKHYDIRRHVLLQKCHIVFSAYTGAWLYYVETVPWLSRADPLASL